jgi:hypothetical protein
MKTERIFYQLQEKLNDGSYRMYMVWDGYDHNPLEDEYLDKLINRYTDAYYTDLKQEIENGYLRIVKIHEKIDWDMEVVAFPEYSVCCHPDHEEGHDCVDRAVGCNEHCRCCMGELAKPL